MSTTKLIASAYITLNKIYDGSDGFTVTLSNPTHTILCDSNGDPMVGEIGPNGKAKCIVKVFGTKTLTVVPHKPSIGQYAYYIRRELCENCEVIAPTPDSFYINTVGTAPTGKVVIDVDIEGKNTVRQEMTFVKSISPDINFGVDGKFIYGTNQWCSNINGTPLDSKIKAIKSNQAIYGSNILEIVSERWIFSKQPVYNNKDIVYKMVFRARISKEASNGHKECYIGCKPVDSSGNSCGPDGGNSNKNLYLWNGDLTKEWKEYIVYFGKRERNQITDINGSIKFPYVKGLPSNTVKFYPLFIVNYPVANDGIVEVDCFTIEDVTSQFETTELKNKTVKLETNVNGIDASVKTIKSITDKSDNPMILQCKVNYSAFNTENLGEVYIHGLNSNKAPADVDGICRWMNQDVTLPKTMFDPEKQIPPKTVVFMVYDKNARKWYMIWEEKSDTGSKTWKYLDAIYRNGRPIENIIWSETAHIIVGYFIISDKKQSNGDDIILMAQMFKGALNYKQATTMSLSSSISQLEVIEDNLNMKVDKDGVIAAINIYAQEDGSGNTTSGVKIRGDKVNLQGQVTFDDLSSDNTVGLKKIFNHNNNSTFINGGFIDTNSIKANSIDLLSGLTVMGADNTPVFAISRVNGTTDKGTVEVNGLLKSGNFNETLNTGYKISPDGTAILNQAQVRGDVILPNAGITNFGARIGNENLALDSYKKSYSSFNQNSNKENWCVMNSRVNVPKNAKVGDKLYVTYDFEYSDLVFQSGKNPLITLQGSGNIVGWNDGAFNSSIINPEVNFGKGKSGKVHKEYTITLTSNHLKNEWWDTNVRFDWIYGGSVAIKNFKVETNGRTPWCPAESEQSNHVRFWAGASYENRNIAPFRVLQNGDIFAKNGTYEGLLRGTLDSGDIQIYNNALTVHSPGTENEIIGLRAQQSFFKCDFVFGDKNIEYLNSLKTFSFNNAKLIGRHVPTTTSGASFEFDPNGDTINSFKIINPIIGMNSTLSIGYLNGENNTTILTHSGNKGTNCDMEFARENKEDIDVKFSGNIIVKKSIKSNTNDIEIRSINNEGWGFFAT